MIAIGRDDNTDLYQRQSHSFGDYTRIYLDALAATNDANSGVFSSDRSYVSIEIIKMYWTLRFLPLPKFLLELLRVSMQVVLPEWKVTKTNITENFSIDLKVNSTLANNINNNKICLLIDDDGVFLMEELLIKITIPQLLY